MCGMYSTGSQFCSASSIGWHCVLGNAPSYLLELFILTSACSGLRSLRSASKVDFVVPRARTATRQKKLSRLWIPLLGMVSLTFVLCRGMMMKYVYLTTHPYRR